ncbi:hypothetical protein [Pirellula sp. SH-Sr6A]|uniref:hypothetical protein n=1 Tax=Pirellula sp. SH-Sr6A TaxID=1632865 RepID=UPI0011BA8E8C|nr:hypothetical protein [Pirellula sp. SH-Sr6A]
MNKPLRPTDPGERRCLKCNQEFRSSGAGNRICRDCARINASLKVSEAQLALERGVKRLNGIIIEEPCIYEVTNTDSQFN